MNVHAPRPDAERRPYPADFDEDERCFIAELEGRLPPPIGFAALFAADIAAADDFGHPGAAMNASLEQSTVDAVFARLGLRTSIRTTQHN